MWRTTWNVGIVAGVVFLGGAGCAQSGRGGVEPVSEAPPVHTPAAAAVGEVVSPSALALSGGEVVEFQAMGEEPETLHVERVVAPDGAGWIVTELAQIGGGQARERELTLRQTEDGSIVMSREVNRGEGVVVDFEPPLVVYPARLAPGETFEQKLRMTVHPISNLDRVQAQGNVTQRITWEGRETISLPMGEVESVKLAAIFEADLGGPQVVNESQEWLAEGVGVVAMKKMERTTLLGVRVRANSEWWGRR